jgi:hypothetical protein
VNLTVWLAQNDGRVGSYLAQFLGQQAGRQWAAERREMQRTLPVKTEQKCNAAVAQGAFAVEEDDRSPCRNLDRVIRGHASTLAEKDRQ